MYKYSSASVPFYPDLCLITVSTFSMMQGDTFSPGDSLPMFQGRRSENICRYSVQAWSLVGASVAAGNMIVERFIGQIDESIHEITKRSLSHETNDFLKLRHVALMCYFLIKNKTFRMALRDFLMKTQSSEYSKGYLSLFDGNEAPLAALEDWKTRSCVWCLIWINQ